MEEIEKTQNQQKQNNLFRFCLTTRLLVVFSNFIFIQDTYFKAAQTMLQLVNLPVIAFEN